MQLDIARPFICFIIVLRLVITSEFSNFYMKMISSIAGGISIVIKFY